MGYMRHHAIVVTSYDSRINVARAYALDCGLEPSAVITSRVNGYRSFFVPPDGSKEGWEESDAGDVRRERFVEWLNRQRFSDGSTPFEWVEVQYGDDEGETAIVRHSDEIQASDDYNGPCELDERKER